MTIAALHRLLDEELPDVPRHPAPLIPHTARKRQAMQQQPSPIPGPRITPPALSTGAPPVPIGKVIAWAEQHPTRTVARKGEQARALLLELRALHSSAEEIAQADAEEQRLQEQLDAIRARKAALLPKKRKAPNTDYNQGEVRSWARGRGLDVPARGTIPAAIVQAWREAQAGGTQ
ncbi:histone-like nucleoid-structuring protein Lsr2 [Streptomyces sp. NPDC058620]|uniref:Lsr2 family DNA-binding protein n=1 Tax=Streptomyces sp. NPDC058620 TaxID=3346560 RepID=UPI0036555D0F